ncbi:phytanoyl-CoA dioxygenase family protein [Sphingomonas sp. HT-1]|uniref:phytanoyl-CoA dioxygenase family protein n=1 Tax=unclassified Sphingomonas TaxID=196159 RepID=UPI000301B82B|nr:MULTISPECIES: phytanoyl-CoA dioxygenase family protein [unclassified Sphingomonas]KTF69704.1 phytanoyl-CoA dioxygenase [Sphingomonas sp. WG]
MTLDFERDGAAHLAGAAAPFLSALYALAGTLPPDRAGLRLHGASGLAALLESDALGAAAAARLGPTARPVRAILFDKSAATNWALGWHQDRTIAVRERVEVTGYGPWSIKQGLLHVEPPFALIETMVTLRIHLDAVPADNAPLLIAPGSHRLGRVPEAAVVAAVGRCGTATCLAEAGDIWMYSTPILHASAASSVARHRRVLQVDYAMEALPGGLEWLGI